MALVASPARLSPGSAAPHGSQTSEGYEHPQPVQPGSVAADPTPIRSQPTHAQPAQKSPDPQPAVSAEAGRFRAAGFWRRAIAGLVDLAILLPVWAAAGLALCLAFGQPIPRLPELSPDLLIAALLDGNSASESLLAISGILFFLYFFLFHAMRGQTPGKQLLGLRIIDGYGGRPGLLRTLVRTASYLLSALPCSLGFVWIGFDRERRALHDWIAGTYVVRSP
jgi:uncharacterized RDD family membrane protein YckC